MSTEAARKEGTILQMSISKCGRKCCEDGDLELNNGGQEQGIHTYYFHFIVLFS